MKSENPVLTLFIGVAAGERVFYQVHGNASVLDPLPAPVLERAVRINDSVRSLHLA